MKTAIEYLQALEEELKYLPQKETRKIIQVYQEKINNALDYGEKIDKILKSLPTPEEVAKGVYDSKKVNYLDKRQREYRRKEIVNGLTSLLLAVIVVLLFVGVLGYLGIMNFKMLKIIPKFAAADRMIMGGFVISYFLAMLIVMIYLFDLGFLLATFLLAKFLVLLPKIKKASEQLQGFSISGFFENITKKKYILGKVLIVFSAITVVFGMTSLIGKGYIYRSFSDIPTDKNIEEVALNNNIENIIIDSMNAQVVIRQGTTFKVLKQAEFDRNFKIETNNNTAKIVFDEHQNYDFLGLLNEPTILITIEVPAEKNLDISLEKGKISINDVSLKKFVCNIETGSVVLKDANIQELVYDSEKVELNSNSCNYASATINVNQGSLASSNDEFTTLNIKNGSGNVAIKENKFKELTINNISGILYIEQTDIEKYNYESVAAILNMQKIETEYFNMTTKASSQITLNELAAQLFTFDLNAGYINMTKISGDVNVVKSLSNMTISELVGNLSGNFENAKVSLYNSIFDDLKLNIKNGNLDLDDINITKIELILASTQAILIDVYSKEITFDLNRCKVEYHNNDQTHIIGLIKVKNVGSQFNVDESVKYGEMKDEQ